MRDTARAPQPPTDQPTGHQMSRQGLAQNDQKCQFWTKFGLFGPKILILTGVSKSFGTNIMEKPPRQLVRIVFWSGIKSNGPKMPIFGSK